MRVRVLAPTSILLLVFCGILCCAVYLNTSSAIYGLLNRQLDETLDIIEGRVIEARRGGSSLRNPEYQGLIADFGVADGGVFVVDSDGVVIADTKGVMALKNVTSTDWYAEARNAVRSEFNATYGDAQINARSVVVDGKLVVSYLSSSLIDELTIRPVYVIGIVGLVGVIAIGIIIYLLVTRLLINPIESLREQVEGLPKDRKIDLKPLRSCPGLVAVAERLNGLLKENEARSGQIPRGKQLKESRESQAFESQGRGGQGWDNQSGGDRDPDSQGRGDPSGKDQGRDEGVLPSGEKPSTHRDASGAEGPFLGERPPTGEEAPPGREPLPCREAADSVREAAKAFEFVPLIREAFVRYRDSIDAKGIGLSVFTDNDLPHSIVADRQAAAAGLDRTLAKVFDEARTGSQVQVMVKLLPVGHATDTSDMEIAFDVRYNEQEDRVLLIAKRG